MLGVRGLNMVDDDSPQSNHRWLSLGAVGGWLWERTFTRQGAVIVGFFCLSIAFVVASSLQKPWYWPVLFSPLVFIFLVTALLLFMVISFVGDTSADWAIEKLLSNPNPRNPLHQVLYLLLSCFWFVVMAFFLGMGDPDIRGYWRH